MFNPETCKRCGACVIACPSIEMAALEAKEAMVDLIEKRDTAEAVSLDIIKNCAGCGLCNEICPTNSNPADLRKEILLKNIRRRGSGCLSMMHEDVPENIMTVGLKHNTAEKEKDLEKYTHPEKSKTVFFVGCSTSYIYTDMAKTCLLNDFPIIGGMKYCCGAYIHKIFGEEEAKIRGQQLLDEYKKIGVEKLITFCPECDDMLKKVYPELLDEFNIEIQNIASYLLEKHESGKLDFKFPVNKKITFHDSCAWRALNDDVFEAPRKLLQSIGAEVVEMKHNRNKSICCGAPLRTRNPAAANMTAEKRIKEAVDTGAEAIAVACNGCFALAEKAAEKKLDTFNIIELVQMAIGEEPPHQIAETMGTMVNNFITTVSANPELMQKKYKIEGGVLKEC